MLVRGVIVSYETIRQWCAKFGPVYAAGLRRRHPRPGDTWHLDQVFVTINGRRHYLWRAVDQDGNVHDILVQPRRDAKAAQRFFRKLLTKQCRVPRVLVTDTLRSYQVAHGAVMASVEQRQSRYLNRAENSHQPTRHRERAMKRFRTPGAAQRFLAVFSVISPHSRPRRHRLTADELSHRDGRPLRHLERHHQAVGSRLEPRTSTAPEPPSALFPLHLKQVTRPIRGHPRTSCLDTRDIRCHKLTWLLCAPPGGCACCGHHDSRCTSAIVIGVLMQLSDQTSRRAPVSLRESLGR